MNLPVFPKLKPLEFEDKSLFDEYFKKNPLNISEYTFTNVYIWRKIDETMVTSINGNLCMLVTASDNKKYFMMPLGNLNMQDTLSNCLAYQDKIIRLTQEFIDLYAKDNTDFSIEEDRNSFDYIYLANDLMDLKGRKFDSKRNHINHFLKQNNYAYESMNKFHINECLTLNEEWYIQKLKKNQHSPIIKYEKEVVDEALNNFESLDVKGGIVKIRGKIEAFSIGEKLNDNTAVIYIEKANHAIRGLSQIINREFIANEWANIMFINREQDLGNPGLRKAKQSYQPIRLEKKYSIKLKNK